MELHQLRYFLAVAEEGNFTRAAEKSFVSQPSLSAQIIKLEAELGQKLFDRLGRRAELTQAGRFLEGRARAILMEVENAQRQIKEVADEVAGVVSIGATPSVTPYLIPPVIAACRERYPKLEIRVIEGLRRRLMEDLLHGEIEVAFASYSGDVQGIDAEPILQEALYLAIPAGHRLASQKERIAIADFKNEPIILLGESATLSEKVYSFFGNNDSKPNVVALCSQVRTVKELVNAGLGLAILPEMAQDRKDGFEIVYRSLASARMNRLLFALTHARRYLAPGARVFIDTLREIVDKRWMNE